MTHDALHRRTIAGRWLICIAVALSAAGLAACEKEVVAVRGNSLEAQFAQLNNKNGWTVAGGDVASRNKAGAQKDSNVRLVKSADFSNLTMSTSFQLYEPTKKAQTQPAKPPEQGPEVVQPANSPFGPSPLGPAPR